MSDNTYLKIVLNEMGFKNVAEFFLTAFGWHVKKLLLILSAIITTFLTILAHIDGWINRAIYEPSVMLYTLAGAIVLDWLSGALPALANKQFQKEKAFRVVPILFFHVTILTLLFQAEKAHLIDNEGTRFFYRTLRLGFVNFAFCLYLLSAASNAGRHGYIKGKAVDYITEYIDRHKKAVMGEKDSNNTNQKN